MANNRVFGGRCTELLGLYDQESLSWRTLQTSFEWAEQQSLQALPKSGIAQNGQLSKLVISELRIEELDGLLWRIPKKSQTTDGLLPTPTASGSEHRTKYSQGGRPLMYMLLKSLPTPTVSDATVEAIFNQNIQIVYTENGTPRKISNNGVNGSLGLARTVMLEAQQKTSGKDKHRLNPQFVQWMMGYPTDWLD